MKHVYLASGNAHKAAELQHLAAAANLPLQVISAREIGGMPHVTEDAGSFIGNARKKAEALRTRVPAGAWVLADDSGVCVDALDGGPGVDSAYYAGPQADPNANLRKLIDVMRDVPEESRGAHFLCVLLLLTETGEEVFEGVCGGRLLREPRGRWGFGYDPIFVPDGHSASYAELGDEVKNRISHRAQAWAKFAAWAKESLA
ncbi:MAG TPA: RdgB/HAM1 family non-canonical purine NTP pyrophosphatase [Opitutus sp.]|nr:RdgB/HAM1 family non-canonical purine NTP pyrophosphatase [Opitutus sp.]